MLVLILYSLSETRCREAVRLLVAPAKSHPPPLGGQHEASEKSKKRSELSVISSISTLMLCCGTMLTNSYPVQVFFIIFSILRFLRNNQSDVLLLISEK